MKRILFSLLLLASTQTQAVTCTTDVCTIATGTTIDVARHSLCTTVVNTSGSSLLVPTKTAPELQSFISAAAITGIAKSTCVVSPSYRSIATRTLASGNPINNNKPAGLAAGDLMLALLYNSASLATIVPPTGFVAVPNKTNYTCGSTYRSTMFYKIADAGDAAAANDSVNFRFSMAGGFVDTGYMLTAWKDVSTTTPIETASHNTSNGTTITYNGVTNANIGARAVLVSESGDVPNSQPAGFTIDSSLIALGTEYSSKALNATGATGNFTGTYGVAVDWCSALIVLNPL